MSYCSLSSLNRPEIAAVSTENGVAKAGQANENSKSTFRSVNEISSAGDRSSGFGSVDVVCFVPFLLSRQLKNLFQQFYSHLTRVKQ